GRNRAGFWVARDSDGVCQGEFSSKVSAVAFAHQQSAPRGCALMFVTVPIEDDSAALETETSGLPPAAKEGRVTITHFILTALVKTGTFLRHAVNAVIEAREQRALIEAQLYRGRYKHSSKFDDDLPIVHQ
ncbi:MAG: hypothetical protein ACXWKA_20140, partial [Xanthobacteraceae bacterium]